MTKTFRRRSRSNASSAPAILCRTPSIWAGRVWWMSLVGLLGATACGNPQIETHKNPPPDPSQPQYRWNQHSDAVIIEHYSYTGGLSLISALFQRHPGYDDYIRIMGDGTVYRGGITEVTHSDSPFPRTAENAELVYVKRLCPEDIEELLREIRPERWGAYGPDHRINTCDGGVRTFRVDIPPWGKQEMTLQTVCAGVEDPPEEVLTAFSAISTIFHQDPGEPHPPQGKVFVALYPLRYSLADVQFVPEWPIHEIDLTTSCKVRNGSCPFEEAIGVSDGDLRTLFSLPRTSVKTLLSNGQERVGPEWIVITHQGTPYQALFLSTPPTRGLGPIEGCHHSVGIPD